LTTPPTTVVGRLVAALGALREHPRGAALLGATCIAFSGIFYRWAAVSPSTGTVFRALFGLPILGAVAVYEVRRYGGMPRRTVGLAAVAGAFFAGDLTFWHHAVDAVGAGLATVLGNLQVLVVGFVAWIAFRERPSRGVLLALPVVLIGVVLISGAVGGRPFGADPTLGVVLGLATALCYSGYLLLIRLGGSDLRRPAGPVALATLSTAIVGAAAGALLTHDLDASPPIASLGWLAVLGVTSQSLGYLLISLSLPRLPAILTSTILLAQPVMTVGLSMVLLGEAPSIAQLVGVALVIGGIAIATVPFERVRASLRSAPA
jgi:drug/metabolite transporter (DMT)-like permease